MCVCVCVCVSVCVSVCVCLCVCGILTNCPGVGDRESLSAAEPGTSRRGHFICRYCQTQQQNTDETPTPHFNSHLSIKSQRKSLCKKRVQKTSPQWVAKSTNTFLSDRFYNSSFKNGGACVSRQALLMTNRG